MAGKQGTEKTLDAFAEIATNCSHFRTAASTAQR